MVRNFTRVEASEVIRECAMHDGIEVPAEIHEMLASDLAEQDEVRPAELQIVCTALRGDFRLQHYRIAGGASAILSRHIAVAVETTRQPALARLVLRSLCDFAGNAKAEAAPVATLVHRIGPQRNTVTASEPEVQLILEQFEAERLAVRSKAADGAEHWSLIHDYLVGPVKLATQDASTRAEDALHIFEGYLAEARSDKSVVIPTTKLREIRQYCPPNLLQSADAKRLLRRSILLGYGRPASLFALAILITGSLAVYLGTEPTWKPANEFRHWKTANESGRTALGTFKGKVITYPDRFSVKGDAVVWDLLNSSELGRYASDGTQVAGRYLVMKNLENKTFKLVDLEKMETRSFPITYEVDFGINEDVDGSYLIVNRISETGKDKRVQLFSLESGKLVFDQPVPRAFRTSIRVAPDQDKVVIMKGTGEESPGVPSVWSLSTGQFIAQLSTAGELTSWFDISLDRREVVTAQKVDGEALSIQICDISASTPKLRIERRFKTDDFFWWRRSRT